MQFGIFRIFPFLCTLNTRGCLQRSKKQNVPQAEMIPILPDTDNAGEGNCKLWYTSSHDTPLLFTYQVLNFKDKRMKSVLIIFAGSLASFAVAGNESDPVDSLKISRDVSLNEVVVTATKVSHSTPVA